MSAPATVFLGTPSFAVPVLRRLAESPHRPRLVVTPPDRPSGRGRRLVSPPAADAARELGIELLQTSSVNEPNALERVRAAGPELAVVCAFGQLIREPLLSELEMLNVHPSLLPRWRGAAPIERAIMAGDAETGVTIMRVSAELDAGPVALQERAPIGDRDDFGSLAVRLADLAGPLIVRGLDLRAADRLPLSDQDESLATYAEKIDSTDRRLDPALAAVDLDARVRALHPHIGAYLELEGDVRLGVRRAAAVPSDIEPGRIEKRGDELLLGCADGGLRLERLQPPGGRAMSAGDFLRGHQVPALAR